MTRLSSIFSFETLRVSRWFPRATVAALALFVGAEAAARYAVHKHKLQIDPSGRQLIEQHCKAVTQNQGDIWLLGNSTLGFGVDQKLLAQRTGANLLKLPHGSATVGATARLLDFYLGMAPHAPREVVVFVTKDDLNLNGFRASASVEYETLTKRAMRKPQEFSMLWQARDHITTRVEEEFYRVVHHGKKMPVKKETPFDGKIDPGDEMYTRLIQNYAMDQDAIPAIAETAHRHGVANVALVLVPCTDVYVRFHDRQYPKQSYAKLRADIAAECTASGIKFYDFGDPSTNYAEFQDGYHLNNKGATRFTEKLAAGHVLLGPANANAAQRTSAPASATTDTLQTNPPAAAEAGVAD
jgi:hypothetical protein